MKETIQIQSVMKQSPVTIGASQTLKVAKEQMREHGVRHLPVQLGGKLVGVLSERDIDFAVAMDKLDPESILVKDAISSAPYVVTPETPVYEVAREMGNQRIGCALIAEDDRVKGIFTTVDAALLLAEVLSDSSRNA